MAVTSKSLHHSNVVIVFSDTGFRSPEIGELASLYSGEDARGARFIEDPVLQTKLLALPKLNIKITIEGMRLRVDDDLGNDPKEARIIRDLLMTKKKLFSDTKVTGFGFNYDVYYKFNNIIPIRDIFENFFNKEVLGGKELRDIGVQFTVESGGGKIVDTWFFKIVSPLELAVHLNRHFSQSTIPTEKEIARLFENCYNREIDEVIKSFESTL